MIMLYTEHKETCRQEECCMRSFEYNTPTHVVFGKDSVDMLESVKNRTFDSVCLQLF